MLRLFFNLLKPYMSHVHVRIINQLIRDNETLNRRWREKYEAMEREMYYWKDKYMDEIIYEPDHK